MTDADRTDKAEERENMYIMMFTLQSLQNYGLSVKKTVERTRHMHNLFICIRIWDPQYMEHPHLD